MQIKLLRLSFSTGSVSSVMNISHSPIDLEMEHLVQYGPYKEQW